MGFKKVKFANRSLESIQTEIYIISQNYLPCDNKIYQTKSK
jgi:hypothetical protein